MTQTLLTSDAVLRSMFYFEMRKILDWLRTHKPWTWIFSGVGVSLVALIVGGGQQQAEITDKSADGGIVFGEDISIYRDGNIAGRDVISLPTPVDKTELFEVETKRIREKQAPTTNISADGRMIADGDIEIQGRGNIAGRDVVIHYQDTASMEQLQVVSEEYGVTKAALRNFFRSLGREPVDIDDLDVTLREIASRFSEQKERFIMLEKRNFSSSPEEAIDTFNQISQSIRSAAAIGSPDSEFVQLLEELASSARADAAEAYRLNDLKLHDYFLRQAEAFENAKAEAISIYTSSFRSLRGIERAKRRFDLSMKVKNFSLARQQFAEALSIFESVSEQIDAASTALPSVTIVAQ